MWHLGGMTFKESFTQNKLRYIKKYLEVLNIEIYC